MESNTNTGNILYKALRIQTNGIYSITIEFENAETIYIERPGIINYPIVVVHNRISKIFYGYTLSGYTYKEENLTKIIKSINIQLLSEGLSEDIINTIKQLPHNHLVVSSVD
jgi:hypothetical protein